MSLFTVKSASSLHSSAELGAVNAVDGQCCCCCCYCTCCCCCEGEASPA